MTKKVLFITWDGPQTSYMEGLFMPILSAVQAKGIFEVHVIQFTWGSEERVAITKNKAVELNIKYTALPIIRKPIATIGIFISLYKGIGFLKKYISNNHIDFVMPRSTMPSIMVNRINKKHFKIVFDADGLPIEERVDFSGLLRTSKQYKFFKNEETKMFLNADAVITRSEKAINIHLKTIGNKFSDKFSVVLNGRNIDFFNSYSSLRSSMRNELNISDDTKVFVYCGSLGPQYGWDEMITIFKEYLKINNNSKFLILTGNIEFAQERITNDISDKIIVRKVPFEEVPKNLSVADLAFAIREPKFSMQGVAPIKLGEYLLMGLPTIASAGIGDSENLISQIPNCFLFEHKDNSIEKTISFINELKVIDHQKIREFGVEYFSIEKSAESYIRSFNKLL
jgi:glycosyltransferase involved in cell wall biosynthesis